jgi:hypothetical protein
MPGQAGEHGEGAEAYNCQFRAISLAVNLGHGYQTGTTCAVAATGVESGASKEYSFLHHTE